MDTTVYSLDSLLRAATALDSSAGPIHRFADSLAQPAWVEHAADDPLALWSPLRTHSLRVRLGEETTRTDLDGRIRDWLFSLPETVPGDAEEVASVTGPSRDPRFAAVLMPHHFTAVTNLAVRPISADDSLHEQPSQGFPGLWARHATPEDLPALADMAVQLQRFDTNFGLFGIRPNAEAHLRAELHTMLAGEPELTWVLESDTGLAGFTQVHTTQQSPGPRRLTLIHLLLATFAPCSWTRPLVAEEVAGSWQKRPTAAPSTAVGRHYCSTMPWRTRGPPHFGPGKDTARC